MTVNKNENGQIMYGSLLPLFVILAILFGAGFFLLRGEYELPKLRKDPTEITRLQGFPTIVENSEHIDKQRVIIKSEEELSNFLNSVDPLGKLVVNDNINFDREILIGVATETNPTFGYNLKVKKVYMKEDGSLLVSIREKRPGEACDEDKVPNIALDLISITKTNKDVSFERVKETVECAVDL